jgi:hypothetical protein
MANYDLALSEASHDLLIVNGDLMLIDDAERIAQQIKITLKFFLCEWFLDTSKGVPYLEYVLVKNPNMNHIRAIFREKILDVPGVTGLSKIELSHDRKARALSVNYEAETTTGLLTRREVLEYGSI